MTRCFSAVHALISRRIRQNGVALQRFHTIPPAWPWLDLPFSFTADLVFFRCLRRRNLLPVRLVEADGVCRIACHAAIPLPYRIPPAVAVQDGTRGTAPDDGVADHPGFAGLHCLVDRYPGVPVGRIEGKLLPKMAGTGRSRSAGSGAGLARSGGRSSGLRQRRCQGPADAGGAEDPFRAVKKGCYDTHLTCFDDKQE